MINNTLLRIKIKERLNKLSSFDYDSIEDWQVIEAFNKCQLEYAYAEAAKGEDSVATVESVQHLLTPFKLAGTHKDGYYESVGVPADFMRRKRITCNGSTKDCKDRPFTLYPATEANLDDILKDPLAKPDFDWAESVFTIVGNRVRIYTNNLFEVTSPTLLYYKVPSSIQIIGVADPSAEGTPFETEVVSSFKDACTEKIIDATVALLAGDIENILQVQRNAQRNP